MIETAPTAKARRLLGGHFTQMARERVYSIPGGLEIERTERFQVSRRRILFREAFLVTLHRTAGRPVLAFWIGVGLASAGLALFLIDFPTPFPSIVAAGVSALSVGMTVVRLQNRIDVITLVTKRARIQVVLPARSGRAREVYEEIVAGIREARPQTPEDPAWP